MPKKTPPALIIQNFRSWKGKSYIELNNINFLFGPNSSGKSSVISALALMKQAANPTQAANATNDRFFNSLESFDNLVTNGAEINLGKIEAQVFADPKIDFDRVRISALKKADKLKFVNLSEQIGFGYRIDSSDHFHRQIANRHAHQFFRQTGNKIDVKNHYPSKILAGLEVCMFYSPQSSKLVGLELNTKNFCLLRIRQNEGVESNTSEIEICQDESFWEKIIKDNSDKFNFDGNLESLPQIFKSFISDSYMKIFVKKEKLQSEQWSLNMEIARHQNKLEQLAEKLVWLENRSSNIKKTTPDHLKKLKTLQRDAEKSSYVHEMELHQNTIETTERELAEKSSEYLELEDHLNNMIENCFQSGADYRNWKEFSEFKDDLKKYGKVVFKNEGFGPLAIIKSMASTALRVNPLEDVDSEAEGTDQLSNMAGFEQFIGIIFEKVLPGSSFIDLTRTVGNRFHDLLMRLDQIGPHRERPDRVSVINPNLSVSSVGKSGQFLLNLLHSCSEDEKEELNKWLERLEILYTLDTKFHPQFNVQEIILIDPDGLQSSIADVGYGISQVLPIIVQAVLSKNRLISVEQPELHIHPKIQANLADLFIWSTKTRRNKFMIETHSEHIILRLMRLQRENIDKINSIQNKDGISGRWNGIFESININVIEKIGVPQHSVLSNLKINKKGEFSDSWPGGFFEERFKEKGLL